jgi:hypothetical protein
MFIETVPNRGSPPAVLLRESYRDEQGRSQKRTLANLSKLPRDMIDTLKAVLKGGTVVGTGPQELEVERSLPHGHVAAALGMIRKIGLDRLILGAAKDPMSRRCCDLIIAMMVDRLIAPRSKLGFVRAVDEETACSSLGTVLHLGRVKDREAYEALDWLLERQARIEHGLARRHLEDGVLVLYDVSSSYFEGRCCPLARYVLILIDAPDMFPGERLIVCRNHDLAAERARKREDLLAATERELARIAAQVRRRNAALRGAAEIGLAVGAVLNRRKMAKHFVVTIGDAHLSWHRRLDQIEAEARLDGIYVIRTSMSAEHMDAAETVQAYKDLSRVERAFRSLKSVDLEIRPIRHWTADRVRAHVFLCMLAYHVEWHLRYALAPLLFHDTDLTAAKAERTSPVAATEPSDVVKAKKETKRSADGQRVMSFADLVAHLGTLVRNTMRVPARPQHRFTIHSRPTALQEAAFTLLELDPVRVQ